MHELRSDKVVKKGLLQSKTIATGLRFRMFDKLYCIVNSHFRGTSQKQRNQEYKEIIDSLNFGENLKMYNHDIGIWIGSLNYALKNDPTSLSQIQSSQFSKLVEENDELAQDLEKKNCFEKFLESTISFAPYSRTKAKSDQKKSLSYPDRILYFGRDLIIKKYDQFPLKNSNGPIYLLSDTIFSRKSVYQLLAKREVITETQDDEAFLETTFDVDHWELSDFEFGDIIAVNQNYYLRKCFHKIIKKDFAAKIIQVTNNPSHLIREIQLLMSLDSPFIMKHYQYFEEKYFVVIYDLLEYGDMFDYLKDKQKLSEQEVKFYVANIILGLRSIHDLNIAHRDLKPENIRFQPNGYLKLVGFHLSKAVVTRTFTKCGTMDYVAPEVILNIGHSKGVDFWALGVLAYELLAGYPPFYSLDKNQVSLIDNIIKKRVTYPEHFSKEAQSFIGGLLNKDKNYRLGCLKGGIDDVINHAWLKDIDWKQLEKMQVKAPYIPEKKGFENTEFGTLFEDFEKIVNSEPVNVPQDDILTSKIENYMYGKVQKKFERGSFVLNEGDIVKIVTKTKDNSENEYEYQGKRFISPPLDLEELILIEQGDSKKYYIKKKAFDAFLELVNTEKSYVHFLGIIIEHYYVPLQEIVSSETHQKIFSCIQTIYKLNSSFLDSLNKAMEKNDDSIVMKVLEDFVKAFKLYTPYIQNYQSAFETVYLEKSKNPRFEKHLLTKSVFLVKQGLDDLFSLLIMPIQRLPRYQMLFQNISKYSEGTTHEFYEKLTKEMKEIVNYCNEKTREYDCSIKVFNLQRKYGLEIDNTQELLLEKKSSEEVYLDDEGKTRGVREFSMLKNGTLLCETDSKKKIKIIQGKWTFKDRLSKDLQGIEFTSNQSTVKILFEDDSAKIRWKEILNKFYK